MGKRDEGRKPRISKNIKTNGVKWYFYTEGTKTEPNYLNSLFEWVDKDKENIQAEIEGKGMVALSLVKYAIEQDKNVYKEHKSFVLFDKDDNDKEDFNKAIELAENNGIIPIWSNECFELWLILHFNLYSSNNKREDYFKFLSKKLETTYDKNIENIFELVKGKENIKIAYKNALQLHNNYQGKKYSDMSPCTMVYLIIEDINEIIKIF